MARQTMKRRPTLRYQHSLLEDVAETSNPYDTIPDNGQTADDATLREKCATLRPYLVHMKGLEEYLSVLLLDGGNHDPVRALEEFVGLGLPLCRIWNIYARSSQPNALIDWDQFEEPETEYVRMLALSSFAMHLRLLQGSPELSLRDFPSDDQRLSEKSIDALTFLVSMVPSSAFTAKLMPLPPPKPPEELYPPPPGWHDLVEEFLDAERDYARALELIQSFASALSDHQALDEETIRHVFPKKLFTFQRKFIIRLENTAQLPWHAQRWGHQFLDNEGNFAVTYRMYCVNSTLAMSDLKLANEKLDGKFNVNDITTALDRPLQRLSEYAAMLMAFRSCASNSPSQFFHYSELFHAYTSSLSLYTKIAEAQRHAKTSQVTGDLSGRISDWKGHDISSAGLFLLHGRFAIRQGNHDVEHHLFLFDRILLCCDEVQRSPSRRLRQSSFSFKPRPLPNDPEPAALQVQAWIPINEIEDILALTAKGSSYNKAGEERLLLSHRGKHLKFTCASSKQKRQWESELQRLRASSSAPPDVPKQGPNVPYSPVMDQLLSPLPHLPGSPGAHDVPTLAVEPPTPPPAPWTVRSQSSIQAVASSLLNAPRRWARAPTPSMVKVKFHLAQETFATRVRRDIAFDALRQAVIDKWLTVRSAPTLRLASSSVSAQSPETSLEGQGIHFAKVRLQYVDDDNLMVTIGCTEDVGSAFGKRHSVTLFAEISGV
ncbi:hypothetical protein HGRIS_004166 [Hohenbuehelia grisea]|uniref:DH domain-containing protein n=1 Tax=Hohenbuehelia grisea TaxID=104357 RepID=A0ABR3JHT5_9AGAR